MEDLSTLMRDYYDEICIIPNNTRETEQVFARSAMMVAMRKYMTLMQIGRIFDKNHATIHHAVKNHEMNHDWSELYRYYYSTAVQMLLDCPIENIKSDNRLQAQFTRQKMRIVELEYEVQKLKLKCQELNDNCSILRKQNKNLKELIDAN